MKTKLFLITISILLFSSFNNYCIAQNSEGYDYLKTRLEKTKSLTIDVINSMPEKDFKYKPTDEVRSFSALASHVVYSIEWNIELMKGAPIKWEPGDEERYSKEELIQYANVQFDHLIKFIGSAKETPELTDKIIDVLNHNSLHRGQLITYLRLKGLKPKYR